MDNNFNSNQNKKMLHAKKMIAPFIVAAILCVYYIAFAILCFIVPMDMTIKLMFGIIPLAIAGVMIYVLVQRINEIRSGEEDDLSNY